MKVKKNTQLIHEELWNVVRCVNDRVFTPSEADAITNAVGKMVKLAEVDLKAKELHTVNPLDKVKTPSPRKLQIG